MWRIILKHYLRWSGLFGQGTGIYKCKTALGWCSCHSLFLRQRSEVNHAWRLSVKVLMPPFFVVKFEVLRKTFSCICHRAISFEIDIFILHAFPKPFNKNVVHPTAFAIHTDRNVLRVEGIGKHFRCKLTALIRVDNFRAAVVGNSFFQSLHAKWAIQCIIPILIQ